MDSPFPPTLRLLRWAVHGTFAVLLVIAIAAVAARPWLVVGGLLLGALYGLGLAGEARGLRRYGSAWLIATALVWAALTLGSAEFVWIAFPLYFACLHLLPVRVAVPGVVLLTAASIAAEAWHAGGLTPPLM